ncbi:16S rRNA (cytidine1402-2'-O)-methyltransferase [Caldanaerobacter subterraneus subsp. tengcongensis MB4]|uniref:Ribosomal RNA small subunit methyltransferase I n=2 Tax=Caldanaerobacter subterraneus TaxID=911092 RepID=Q8RDD6_CALS4|nr:16S rRNA (cytidine(1402)-2'-O)-methyltransferase [Caldanaerobacter subterraneus]AAM23408.1 predicted methyltransferases [Caldanaerobacter subterraneus subsp. tengcongensis MB4]KKC30868.1 methyltransferase [Caldanaerobacter subterraneus subsp. pacificus DSM 12653]MCS3917114.1 16S rRNA (cytidine1402-2'-O)-methyltransferase [Caldanaerobacter subterraneus subsp. tengcongensis MB4]
MEEYGTLYLCPTPIGNLEDITLRVLRVLSEVDLIAAEDTRQTLKLLNHYEIKKSLVSYHEHNKVTMGPKLIEKLKSGKSIALVTDAGTPSISDPGEELVRLCIQEGIKIVPLPGPTAAITALIASGLDASSFVFEGFLPKKSKERREKLERISREERTTILYESPHRLKETLKELKEYIGERKVVVARELTKIHEEFIRGTVEEVLEKLGEEVKGEIVIVIEGAKISPLQKDPKELLDKYLKLGMDKKEAVKKVAEELKVSKREVYKLVIDEDIN